MLVPRTGDDPVTSCFSDTIADENTCVANALECIRDANTSRNGDSFKDIIEPHSTTKSPTVGTIIQEQILYTQIADFLPRMLPKGRPRRLARMSWPGEKKRDINPETRRRTGPWILRDKYEDIYGSLTRQMLRGHAAGAVTYSCTLDLGGLARAGAIDVDTGGKNA